MRTLTTGTYQIALQAEPHVDADHYPREVKDLMLSEGVGVDVTLTEADIRRIETAHVAVDENDANHMSLVSPKVKWPIELLNEVLDGDLPAYAYDLRGALLVGWTQCRLELSLPEIGLIYSEPFMVLAD